MSVASIGTHCILELHGCPADRLNDEAFVRQALEQATKQGLSTLLKLTSHCFDPQGVTALGLLAESHISIHTWPESGYAAVDVFTCGQTAAPKQACAYLVQAFDANQHSLQVLTRGRIPVPAPGANPGSTPDAPPTSATSRDQEDALCQAPN